MTLPTRSGASRCLVLALTLGAVLCPSASIDRLWGGDSPQHPPIFGSLADLTAADLW
jgi:hypothetical protein